MVWPAMHQIPILGKGRMVFLSRFQRLSAGHRETWPLLTRRTKLKYMGTYIHRICHILVVLVSAECHQMYPRTMVHSVVAVVNVAPSSWLWNQQPTNQARMRPLAQKPWGPASGYFRSPFKLRRQCATEWQKRMENRHRGRKQNPERHNGTQENRKERSGIW